MLRATTACTFSTSQLPKVVRRRCVLYIFTWKCASRHNGVHFFDISTSKSGPNVRCFYLFYVQMCFPPQQRAIFHLSSGQLAPLPPTFRPSGAANHWKNTANCDVPTFSRTCLFFLLVLFRSDLLTACFSSLTLPTSAFPFVHIVGSLTSKLPSITQGRVSFSHEAQTLASIMSLQLERDKELTLLESLRFQTAT